jgi:hypothetical protein
MLRQLGDIGRNPTRLVARKRLGGNVRFAPEKGLLNAGPE